MGATDWTWARTRPANFHDPLPKPWLASAQPLGEALRSMLRAARFRKNAPLSLLVVAGALTAPARPNIGLLCASLVLLLISSAFMTHVNVITDIELDRARKPQLWQWMSAEPRVMMGVLGLELGLVIGGVGVMALLAPMVAAGLGVFTLLTILYSYNFLTPSKGVAWRLKAHWLGHFIVCIGSYLSLWVVGHWSSGSATLASLTPWLPVFFCVSLSEYSLFLAESAIDADEERQLSLWTFGRLLGRHGSSLLALLVWLLAVGGVGAYAWYWLEPALRRLVLLAFGPALLARGLSELLLALGLQRDELLRAQLPDLIFWASRLATAITLAILVL
jgi:hypothetical protein